MLGYNQRRLLTVCFVAIIGLGFFTEFSFVLPVKADTGQSWLQGWSFRKSTTISSVAGAGTDYQIPLNLHAGVGSDNGSDVYLSNNGGVNFSDIRFTASDGVTPLSYWMAGINSSESTIALPIGASWVAADGTIYGSSNGTLFKSLNGGQTWQTLKTFNASAINSMFVDSRGYVYASPDYNVGSLSDSGLWRSTDGGQSWARVIALPLLCTFWGIDENSVGTLFAGVYTSGQVSDAQIYRSTDGGASWVSVYNDPVARHIHDVAVDRSDNYVYASVGDLLAPWNTEYVIRSTDGGNTWSKILSGLPQIVSIEITPGGRLFGTDQSVNGQIFRSTDDLTFTQVLDTGANSYCFWIRQDNSSGKVFASFVRGEVSSTVSGIYESDDNGFDWTAYKYFNYNSSYSGSSLASNFVNGTMYYSVSTDNGVANGFKLSASESARFWVKDSDNLSVSNSTIYIYYGNTNSVSTSSGAQTFPFFDDFSGSSLNSSNWASSGTGEITVAGGTCKISTISGQWGPIELNAVNAYGTGYATEFRSKVTSGGNSYNYLGWANGVGTVVEMFASEPISGYTWEAFNAAPSETNLNLSSVAPDSNTFSNFEIMRDSSVRSIFKTNDVVVGNLSGNLPIINLSPSFYVSNGLKSFVSSVDVDWVFIHKYVNPEPLPGNWGQEETSGPQNNWSQTSQADFQSGTLSNLDSTSVPGQLTVALTPSQSSPLFSDDFVASGGLSNWTTSGGSWNVVNGSEVVVGSANQYSFDYAGNASWSNYTVESKVMWVSGQYGGAIGARLNPVTGTRYSFWVYPSSDGPNVVRLCKGTSWSAWSLLGQASVSTDANWHDLRMDLNGSSIKCYYDGVLVISAVDSSYSSGCVDFETWGVSQAQYDWVNVTSVSGGVLFSDDFVASGGLSNWTTSGGSWNVVNGSEVVVGSANQYSFDYAGNASWSNYTVESKVMWVSGQYGGAIGARLNPVTGTRYSFWVYPSSDGPNVVRLCKGTSWSAWSLLGQASVSTDANWHDLRMDLNGSSIKCYYDGVLVISAVDSSYSSGCVDFETWGVSQAQYDWVNVTTLPSSGSYYASGTLTSIAFNVGYNAVWSNVSWTSSTPTGTAVQFRTRTASTQAGLNLASWSIYYTVTGSQISSPANIWIQYEATLLTNNNLTTPVLYDVTIYYQKP